jgi:DNA-binding LytR/AlgR family response regulator
MGDILPLKRTDLPIYHVDSAIPLRCAQNDKRSQESDIIMGEAIKIAICEDTLADAEHLRTLITEMNPEAQITVFESGEDFLAAALLPKPQPEAQPVFGLVFMDIYMEPGITGVETARRFRDRNHETRLVFTTTSPDHSLDAFDVDAEQYLLKPVAREKLAKILERRRIPRPANIIHILTKDKAIDLAVSDVMYVEVQNHTCFVHTPDAVIMTSAAMKIEHLADLLPPPQFMHCHRSFIVNFSFVESVDRDCHITNGDTVYIRRGDIAACARAFKEWVLASADEETS